MPTSVHYYLRNINKSQKPEVVFNKIIEYLMTFIGDIEIKKENHKSITIYYIGTATVAFLKLEKTGQITVAILPNDNVTINLIKNIAQSIGIRIYNPQINSYLLNDVNIYDLTTIKVDPTVNNVIKRYQLTPLFQFRDSFIFFAKASDSSIHLINRHLLEYLASHSSKKLFKKEFSVKVAESMSAFVALFDRGLISLNFQNYLNGRSKIINLSGFDIQKLPKDTRLNVINFSFDEENQSFIQQDTTDTIPKKYLALKIGQDYTYAVLANKLTKFLNISVYTLYP